ncbi:MAG TPA: 2-phospho-L-lactate guanylyltransferase [Blastocatellia bacterium]|jgi:2-phospho-L-lactate guanylyltransferase|nr:2-phospho-L-lactate guanylyltransferase [Blastocatellia bacterium]
MKAVLIPVKDPARAKTRLAAMLSPGERRSLAWAMFEDVGDAVTQAARPDRVFLVSSFRPAIERARSLGWDLLVEETQVSESDSIDRASRILEARGFECVLRLPADIPLVRASDVDELLSVDLRAPAALMVPSREGTGTNAIIRTPPALFPSRFGPNSLALHLEAAARSGAACTVVNNSAIALDIDEPSDIDLLLELGRGTKTCDLLEEWKISERR